jgi:hypothetical protein
MIFNTPVIKGGIDVNKDFSKKVTNANKKIFLKRVDNMFVDISI